MRMQVILHSLFARPGSAPIWGGKEGEFRDWTKFQRVHSAVALLPTITLLLCLVG